MHRHAIHSPYCVALSCMSLWCVRGGEEEGGKSIANPAYTTVTQTSTCHHSILTER